MRRGGTETDDTLCGTVMARPPANRSAECSCAGPHDSGKAADLALGGGRGVPGPITPSDEGVAAGLRSHARLARQPGITEATARPANTGKHEPALPQGSELGFVG